MVVYGHLWSSMLWYGHIMSCHVLSYIIYGHIWSSMDIYGQLYLCMVMNGHAWLFRVMYGHVWSCVVMFGLAWSCVVKFIYIWSCIVLYGIKSDWKKVLCELIWICLPYAAMHDSCLFSLFWEKVKTCCQCTHDCILPTTKFGKQHIELFQVGSKHIKDYQRLSINVIRN